MSPVLASRRKVSHLTGSTVGGMLPVLAHEWSEAVRRVHRGPPGRREAGGLHSQDPQRP